MTRKDKKYSNYPMWRQLLNRYAGVITVSVILLGVWIVYDLTWVEPEFFESWSCQQMYEYMLDGSNFGYAPHSELTEEQHLKLHTIFANDCKDYKHE